MTNIILCLVSFIRFGLPRTGISLLLAALFFAGTFPAVRAASDWDRVGKILARIVPPSFPPRDFPITDFGAKPDGHDCTEAIRQAMAACQEAGGGRVVIPKGEWLTGAIQLRSQVNLHVNPS